MAWPESNYIRLYVEILLEHKIPFVSSSSWLLENFCWLTSSYEDICNRVTLCGSTYRADWKGVGFWTCNDFKMVSTADDSQPPCKSILYRCGYIRSSFLIGYRLVFKSLWTQQYSRSLIARCTIVGNLPWWRITCSQILKNSLQNCLATFLWPSRKCGPHFAFPWRRVWVDSSSDRDRRLETPAPWWESTHWYLRIRSSRGERRASKDEGEWGRPKETKCWSCER